MRRRETAAYLAVLGVLLVGAVLCLAGSGMSWGRAQRADLVTNEVAVAGGDLVPVARAVGLLALAAVVAVHATRRWGRRLVGGLLGVAGVAVVAQTYIVASDLQQNVLRRLEGQAGTELASVEPGWGGPVVMGVGGAAVAAAGVLLAVLGPRWPSMSPRYERRAATRPASGSSERAAWDALDRGEDPTV
jgi:uncharacterized membrane protein (TIGR02234 family)